MLKISLLTILLCVSFWAVKAQNVELLSPNKNLKFSFYQKEEAGAKCLFYTVSYKDKPVVMESKLDIKVDVRHIHIELYADRTYEDIENFSKNLSVLSVERTSNDTTWKPLYGERSTIRDNYNSLNLSLTQDNKTIQFVVQVRAYNEGIAFRYYFPECENYYHVLKENTEFALPEGAMAYTTDWAQAPYKLVKIEGWKKPSERPMPVVLPNGLFACLAEAQMTDYCTTRFNLHPTKKNTVITQMYSTADLITAASSPWRVIMVAEKVGQLMENNDIILNLNPPCKIKNTSWIKPGKIFREMTLTTEGAMAAIDFAAARNMQYILFDWKWYGPTFTFSSDARKVVAPMDLPKIIEYGKQKGIGIFLYVNLQAMIAQADSILPLYRKWGVKGVKIGFVDAGTHRWTTWLMDIVRKAAENELLLNIHDEYRLTGEQRTYPHILTAEGIRGNEEFPEANNNVIHPFGRFICGAADYTICYYDKRLTKVTHGHQLAMAAVYYSALQTEFWYDKPAMYNGEPEVEFFEKAPSVWDETHVLDAEIGKYISVARRSGEQWFVGTMTNNDARTLKVALDFLPKGKKYTATIYSDDNTVQTKTKVKLTKIKVDSKSVIDTKLMPSGGQAIWIRPE